MSQHIVGTGNTNVIQTLKRYDESDLEHLGHLRLDHFSNNRDSKHSITLALQVHII